MTQNGNEIILQKLCVVLDEIMRAECGWLILIPGAEPYTDESKDVRATKEEIVLFVSQYLNGVEKLYSSVMEERS